MSRPPVLPPRDEFEGEDLVEYDRVLDRFKNEEAISPYFGALMSSPPFNAALNRMGTLVRTAGERPNSYSHVDREWVDQVLAVALGTNVVLKRHVPDALSAGVRGEAIQAVRAGRDDELTEDELLLATYIRQVVSGTVDDGTWEKMEGRLGQRGLVEYTIFIAFLQLIMRLYQAFGLPDPSNEEIDRLIGEYMDGTLELSDYRKGIR